MLIILLIYIGLLFLAHLIIEYTPNIKKYLLFATMFTSSVGSGTLIGIPLHIKQSQDISIIIALIITEIISIAFIYLYTNKILQLGKYTDIFINYNSLIIKISALLLTCGYCAIQIHIIHNAISYILQIQHLHALYITFAIFICSFILFNNQFTLNTNIIQFFTITLIAPIITYYILDHFFIDYFTTQQILSDKPIIGQEFSTFNPIYVIYNQITYNWNEIIKYTLIFGLTFISPAFIKNIILNNTPHTTYNPTHNPSINASIHNNKAPLFQQKIANNIQYNAIIKSIFYSLFIILLAIQALLTYNIPNHEWFTTLSIILSSNIYTLFLLSLIAAALSTLAIDILIIKDTFNSGIYQKISSNLLCTIIIFMLAYTANNPIEIAISMTITWAPITLLPILFKLHNIIFHNYIFILNTLVVIAYLTLYFLFKYYLFHIELHILSSTITAILISCAIYITAYKFKKYSITNTFNI